MDLETIEEEVNRSPFAEGQDYSSRKALQLAVQSWAIREIFEFKALRTTKTRWEVCCKGENCGWRIYATSIGGAGNMFRIKKYTWKHQCVAITHSGHAQATARYLGQWILPTVQQQPRYRPSNILLDVQRELGIEITYSKALRAKEFALEEIYGTHEDAYKAMPKYSASIEETNPNSIIRLDVTAENRFQRVFICYGACAVGFAHCRPLLGLDGTHIKTRYQGIILAATGIDALGQLFPLAYAVVDAENKENWHWMLQLIHRVLEQSAPQFLEAKVPLYFYSI
jgi:hypothetical protein